MKKLEAKDYQAAEAIVKDAVAKDYDSVMWEDVVKKVLKSFGISELNDRATDIARHAARAIRGEYRIRKDDWNGRQWKNFEIEHIVRLVEFEGVFTVQRRPEGVAGVDINSLSKAELVALVAKQQAEKTAAEKPAPPAPPAGKPAPQASSKK